MKGKGTAKGGWRDAARRVAVATGVAVVVALVGSRVNRVEVDYSADPPVEGVLSRRVGAAGVDAGSWASAAEGLSRAFGVRVEVVPFQRARGADDEAPEGGVVKLRDVTLAEALARVLPRVEGPPDGASYVVEGETVYLGRESDVRVREPLVVRAHWVGDLLAKAAEPAEGAADRQVKEDELVGAILDTLMLTIWDGRGPAGAVRGHGDWLEVRARANVQRDVRRLLFLMRHPAGPVVKGAGR